MSIKRKCIAASVVSDSKTNKRIDRVDINYWDLESKHGPKQTAWLSIRGSFMFEDTISMLTWIESHDMIEILEPQEFMFPGKDFDETKLVRFKRSLELYRKFKKRVEKSEKIGFDAKHELGQLFDDFANLQRLQSELRPRREPSPQKNRSNLIPE